MQACIFMFAVVVAAEGLEVPIDFVRYQEDAAQQRAEILKVLSGAVTLKTRRIRAAKSGAIQPKATAEVTEPDDNQHRFIFRTREARTAYVDAETGGLEALKRELAGVKDGTEPPIPWLRVPLVEGQIGRLDKTAVRVTQVVSDGEMLVRMNFFERNGPFTDAQSVWMTGFSTRNTTDDTVVDLGLRVFQVGPTKRYGTAIGGSNTVRCLRALGNDELEAARAQLRKQITLAKPIAPK